MHSTSKERKVMVPCAPVTYIKYGTAQVQGNVRTLRRVLNASETHSRRVRDAFEMHAGRVRD